MRLRIIFVKLLIYFSLWGSAQEPVKMQWKVDNTIREALVYLPADAQTKPSPVIFNFHGHGGTMNHAYRRFDIQKLWPQAIFVCPQGLNTPGQLTDKTGKKAGWQSGPGKMGDRDLKFFDTMLNWLKTHYQVDDKRIYATGHSNGGSFTYLLWAERGDVFAAAAPSSAAAVRLTNRLNPMPCFHLTGKKDPLVLPKWQKFTTDAVLRINSCTSEGSLIDQYATYYKSASSNPVVLYIHPGGHEFPEGAGKAIVDFFKQNSK